MKRRDKKKDCSEYKMFLDESATANYEKWPKSCDFLMCECKRVPPRPNGTWQVIDMFFSFSIAFFLLLWRLIPCSKGFAFPYPICFHQGNFLGDQFPPSINRTSDKHDRGWWCLWANLPNLVGPFMGRAFTFPMLESGSLAFPLLARCGATSGSLNPHHTQPTLSRS